MKTELARIQFQTTKLVSVRWIVITIWPICSYILIELSLICCRLFQKSSMLSFVLWRYLVRLNMYDVSISGVIFHLPMCIWWIQVKNPFFYLMCNYIFYELKMHITKSNIKRKNEWMKGRAVNVVQNSICCFFSPTIIMLCVHLAIRYLLLSILIRSMRMSKFSASHSPRLFGQAHLNSQSLSTKGN